MKFENVLFAVLISVSLFNCISDNNQAENGVDHDAMALKQYSVEFKVPNAPLDSSVYFLKINKDTIKYDLYSTNSTTIPINSKDTLQLISMDTKNLSLIISDGLDSLRRLDIWLYDSTYFSNCNSGSKELRGIIRPSTSYPISGIRVTNMSSSVYTSVSPNNTGIYKMCFSGQTLQYKYALDSHSKKIEIQLSALNDPDTRIDVYLTDDDFPFIPIL